MIPNIANADDDELEEEQDGLYVEDTLFYPSFTYAIDFNTGTIHGMADGEDAIKQAIIKIINTERLEYDIYSEGYGSSINSLIGKPLPYAMSEIKSRITDALIADDRIIDVTNFVINRAGKNSIWVSFDAIIYDGDIVSGEVEVKI